MELFQFQKIPFRQLETGGGESYCTVMFEKHEKPVDSIMGLIDVIQNEEHIIRRSRFNNTSPKANRGNDRKPQSKQTSK